MLTLLTPYQRKDRNIEESMNLLSEMNDRKERKKVEKYFKTKVLGSEVARYVVRRQLTSYLNPNTASGPDRSDQGKLLAQ